MLLAILTSNCGCLSKRKTTPDENNSKQIPFKIDLLFYSILRPKVKKIRDTEMNFCSDNRFLTKLVCNWQIHVTLVLSLFINSNFMQKAVKTKLSFEIKKHDHIFYECHYSNCYKENHITLTSIYL